jgi:hypothetical protein
MSLGDPITPEDIEDIRKRWAALRTPSGDSAITVARIDIRLLLTLLDDANARIARMQREPAYREDAYELVERELSGATDMVQVTISTMDAERVSIQQFAHDVLVAESAGSTLLAAVVALKAEP